MDHIQNPSKRLIHLDLLRLTAIYLVIFNHTGNRGYTLFLNHIDSPVSWFYMAASAFCKIAVPLFFMISGALLLKKEEPLKRLFSKRVLRIAVVLLLVSIPYYYWLHRANGTGILDFLKWIYSDSASTSLWYLYSYLALLLMLPFLRSMVKNMTQKDFVYLFFGYTVFTGVLPCAEYLLFYKTDVIHESLSPVFFTAQNVFFALAGYYFEHVDDVSANRKKKLILSGICSVIAIPVMCLMVRVQARTGSSDIADMEQFFNCFIFVPTVTVYQLMKCAGMQIKNQRICRCLSVLGSAVFGVYLIEKVIRSVSDIVYRMLLPFVGSFVASLLWCFAVLCLSLVVIIPLKHIPFIKKIVNRFI